MKTDHFYHQAAKHEDIEQESKGFSKHQNKYAINISYFSDCLEVLIWLGTDHSMSSIAQLKREVQRDQVKSIENISKMALPEKRFCEYCCVEQPYRTKHCKDCNQCVRKYDHHCFWIGGCVGELNHRKFWAFLFFQFLILCFGMDIAIDGYTQAKNVYASDPDMLNHVQSVWAVFVALQAIFIPFVLGLLCYHSFLVSSGMTTWEHSRKRQITYMKIYPTGVIPFYESIKENLRGNYPLLD